MTSQPVFAISVPIGSYHPQLRACLASLATQKVMLNIAVLDASNDRRVRDIVDEFDDIVTYRFHGPDDGQTDAIIKGWQAVSGDVLGWLNADDALAPGALSHAAAAFAADETRDVVYGHSLIGDDYGYVTGYHWNVMPPGDQILSTCSISQPSCFFKRKALLAAGGLNRDLHFTMDWDLWIRLHKNGAKFHLADEIRSLVLWSKDAKTGGFGKGRRAELRRLLREHASPRDRLNSYIGFATQHFYEYLLPRNVRDWIWRRNISGGQGMFGLSVSGDIETCAEFELFHYDVVAKNQIELKTSSGTDTFEVIVDGELLKPAPLDSSLIRFQLSVPVGSAQICKILLRNRSETAVNLRGMRLV